VAGSLQGSAAPAPETRRPTLSIVIPAYRSERTVEASLRSFGAQGYPAEIVVVDSSPDDRTADVVRRTPGVRLIRSRDRLLPHGARNVGAREATGELLLFTDPALACYGTTWLERGLHLAKFDLWLAGSAPRALEIGPTSGLLCSRQVFEQVGEFRDDLMLGDTVFSWALREAGVPMRLEPRAVFRHDHVQRWPALLRERFARGREFAGLRRPGDGFLGNAYDVMVTVTLVRPAAVCWRVVANARRAGLLRDAVVTFPIVCSGTLAWFAGEVVGMLTTPEGVKH
jgi:hypothetical protein